MAAEARGKLLQVVVGAVEVVVVVGEVKEDLHLVDGEALVGTMVGNPVKVRLEIQVDQVEDGAR